jgi:mercuric ion binding protein
MLLRSCFVVAASLAPLYSGPAGAAERTVALAVDNMTCATCPYIVRETLAAIAGVSAVEVSLPQSRASVTFDDALVGIETLTAATANAGFPSHPISGAGG